MPFTPPLRHPLRGYPASLRWRERGDGQPSGWLRCRAKFLNFLNFRGLVAWRLRPREWEIMSSVESTRRLLAAAERFLGEREGEVIALTSALVAAPTPNLPGDETAAAAVIERALAHYGLPRHESSPKSRTGPT